LASTDELTLTVLTYLTTLCPEKSETLNVFQQLQNCTELAKILHV